MASMKMKSKIVCFFTILLLICFISSATSATFLTFGEVTYKPLANDPPLFFETSTPTVTPTPEPTSTPAPTPRPEPSAWPTIEIQCISGASTDNPRIEVTGILIYNNTGIEDAPIYVGYSADSGCNWTDISLVHTQADGRFESVWIPDTIGYYSMRVQWDGNLTLHWVNATVNLALASNSAGNLFSVGSNSTILNVAYNSENQQLSFITNSTTGTGYVQVCIPKALLDNAQLADVKVDGKPAAFASESQDDVWVISCLYSQDIHAFTIQIPAKQMLNKESTPWITIIVVIVVLVVAGLAVVAIRRRRKTAATVAAILKDNRPVY